MKTAIASIITALLASSPVPASASCAPQDVTRELVTAHSEYLSPRVHAALVKVLAAEEELAQLTYPYDEDGRPITYAEQERRLQDPDSPLKQYLDHHRSRFDSGSIEMDLRSLHECILFDAAFRVASELVWEHPDLDPAELLRGFDSAVVEGSPVSTSELALECFERFRATLKIGPLNNGTALARLTWGVLQQKDWWRQSGHDRGQLIEDLLGVGLTSQNLAWTVDLALMNPMRPSPDPAQDGRGVCGPKLPISLDVGYEHRHEEVLEGGLELVTYLSALDDPTHALDLEPYKVTSEDGGKTIMVPNDLGHLRRWVPLKLEQVRDELYDGGYREELYLAMRRSSSLEQRYLFWQTLAERSSFAAFRVQMLEELGAIVAGTADFPEPPRVEELLLQAQVRALSPDEARELRALQFEARRNEDRFIQTLTELMVDLGVFGQIDAVVATLRDDLAGVLEPLAADGNSGGDRYESLLNDGWFRLAFSKTHELNRILGQALEGSEAGVAELPDVARGNLIWAATCDGSPEARVNLERVVFEGSATDLSSAVLNPAWAEDAIYSIAMGSLIDKAWSSDTARSDRLKAEAAFSTSLAKRPVNEVSKQILLDTLHDEDWSSRKKDSYWGRAWQNPAGYVERLDLVRRLLTGGEIDLLTAQGVLPEGLF
ncbi:hypothetical protein [Engelhardtia mirabilis]|uniref:Uncharacterized protein n=1 Tax=Engelhardtia mirabilis TaxID=2528011 RepID=A0A518BDY6_9BACT|nr:hypothetical protein Pla133_02400 [Planctomycetes bacterium Pla133]QDU99502.1 hypothetical protein Pla86_02400 [Planctomycetes bacterium Pla86]